MSHIHSPPSQEKFLKVGIIYKNVWDTTLKKFISPQPYIIGKFWLDIRTPHIDIVYRRPNNLQKWTKNVFRIFKKLASVVLQRVLLFFSKLETNAFSLWPAFCICFSTSRTVHREKISMTHGYRLLTMLSSNPLRNVT